MDALSLQVSDDGVATIRMGDSVGGNALSHAMVHALEQAFAEVARDRQARCVVLAGLSEVFCSGASAQMLEALFAGRHDPAELLLPRLLLDCPLPCIAAMAGHAVGGGFAFGVAADMVMLGRESRYSLNFLDLGFTPGMGTTRLLEHVLSTAVAHELLYSGEARRGRDFAGNSGINRILPREEVLPAALDLAARIADKPRHALVAVKRVLSSRRRAAFESARTQEALMHTITFGHADAIQRTREAFPQGSSIQPRGTP